ncbi:hypothetical protein NMG60_11002233 [Bertholletia excelsa]
MALGVCTHPFQPSCPPLFRFSSSLRSSSFSSGSFLSSLRKASYRKEDRVPMVAGSLSSTLVFGNSFRFKRSISYGIGIGDEIHRQNDVEFNLQSTRWRLVVPARVSNSSIGIAQMLHDSKIPISPQGHSSSEDFDIQQILEEEKKQGQSWRVNGSIAAATPWVEEKEKIKHLRMEGFDNSKYCYRGTSTSRTVTQSGPQVLQDSHACDSGKYFSDSSCVDYNSSGRIALRSPYGQGYMVHDQNSLELHKLEQKFCEFNLKKKTHTSPMNHLSNEDPTSHITMNGKVDPTVNNKTKTPSKLSSRNSFRSKMGKEI